VIRTAAVVWTIGLSAADPAPSLRHRPPITERRPIEAMQCAGECPSPADQGEGLVRLWRAYASSTSTTAWALGTTCPNIGPWLGAA
jgi:hypothetical protein